MRTDRNRQTEAMEDLDALPDDQQDGAAGMLVQTFTAGVYPTVAGSVYACHPVLVDAADTEGAVPTFTVDGTVTVYAINIGSSIPDDGTYLIVAGVGGRLAFSFNASP